MDRYRVLEYFENNKDFFEGTVNENIEKYRKGDMRISIVDENGAKISGARVKVKQVGHEFKFGANLFLLDELETEEKNELYKEHFKRVFNMATLPFYWTSIEPEKGKTRYDKDSPKYYRRPAIDLCIEFCEENGIEPREHALAYEHQFPEWLANASVDEVKEALESRYKEIAQRYADKIPTIEVTNEMLWDYNAGATKFYNENDYVEWCFRLAEKYFPNNQLAINEYTEACWWANCRATDNYYAYIQANLLKGVRIDAIGMQYHMFCDKAAEMERAKHLYNPISLYEHMDLYSSLVNHLQVTEITIPAYSNDAENEEIQARLIEYLYTLWFSHPNMEQIIYWNLVDGYAYVENPTPERIRSTQGNMTVGENVYYGGLVRFDMTPKPAYKALDTLINKRWRTNLELCSQNGEVSFRGFGGDYEFEISIDGKATTGTFALKAQENNEYIITLKR
ncbi:MAG: endo-1,4-beta-xylanase [Clostridia bacterium]|nr:endo-1,4-beta-xylanase [Clostridia bacterium]